MDDKLNQSSISGQIKKQDKEFFKLCLKALKTMEKSLKPKPGKYRDPKCSPLFGANFSKATG
jgi:hypothetical protein